MLKQKKHMWNKQLFLQLQLKKQIFYSYMNKNITISLLKSPKEKI